MRCGVTALGSSSLRSECRYGLRGLAPSTTFVFATLFQPAMHGQSKGVERSDKTLCRAPEANAGLPNCP